MGLSEGLGYIYKGKPLMEGVGERIGHGIEQGTQNYLKGQELSAEKKRQKEIELHKQNEEVNKLIKPLENPNVLQAWQPEYQNAAKGLGVHTDLLYSKGVNPPDDKLWREHLAQVDLMKQQMENDTKEHLRQKDLGQKENLARERQPFTNVIENSKYSEFRKLYPSGYEDKNLQYDVTYPYKSLTTSELKEFVPPTYQSMAKQFYGRDENGKQFDHIKEIDEKVVPAAVESIMRGDSTVGNKYMQILGRQADEMKVEMYKKANDPYLKYQYTPEEIDQHVDDWKRDMITKKVTEDLHAAAKEKEDEDARLRQPSGTKSNATPIKFATTPEEKVVVKTNTYDKEKEVLAQRIVDNKKILQLGKHSIDGEEKSLTPKEKDNYALKTKEYEDKLKDLENKSNVEIVATPTWSYFTTGKEVEFDVEGKKVKGGILAPAIGKDGNIYLEVEEKVKRGNREKITKHLVPLTVYNRQKAINAAGDSKNNLERQIVATEKEVEDYKKKNNLVPSQGKKDGVKEPKKSKKADDYGLN